MSKYYKVGDLQVWHIPQVGVRSMFTVDVGSVEEGVLLMNVLGYYDMFQWKNRIKPDYSNVNGLRRWCADDGDGKPGWEDWYDDETGEDDPEKWLREQKA